MSLTRDILENSVNIVKESKVRDFPSMTIDTSDAAYQEGYKFGAACGTKDGSLDSRLGVYLDPETMYLKYVNKYEVYYTNYNKGVMTGYIETYNSYFSEKPE